MADPKMFVAIAPTTKCIPVAPEGAVYMVCSVVPTLAAKPLV